VPRREVPQGRIADRIKALRKERGLSQEALAKELGVGRLLVHRWEKGRGVKGGQNPSRESAEKLAAFSSKPLEYFFEAAPDTETLARLARLEERLDRLEDLMDRIDALSAPQAESPGP
jgi:transcriptional regulator with XRE-family HTH domain